MVGDPDCYMCQQLDERGPCGLHTDISLKALSARPPSRRVDGSDATSEAGKHLLRAVIALFGGGGAVWLISVLAGGHLSEPGTSHLTGTGWLIFILGLAVVIAVVGEVRQALGLPENPAPREPRTDFSPQFYDLVTGTKHDSYTAPVNAVTPGGISVRRAKCCARGHLSPKQAVDHAASVRKRIEQTGR